MKRLLLVILALSIGFVGFSQTRAITPKALREVSVLKTKAVKGSENNNNVEYSPGMKSASMLEEEKIGNTWYDVGTNRSMQTRVYKHDDGTIGAVWTYGPEGNPSGNNRGTGYNYFDANNWGPLPTQAIETGAKAGWPSYSMWGDNGETYTCHDYYLGTILGTRVEKGTGTWSNVIQAGPLGHEDISFPRVITTGINRQMIHILSTTWSAYNNQEHALLYARTNDAGASWQVENQLFDQLGPDYYSDVSGDIYDWAEPKGSTIAFLVGDNWMDLVLMKSEDDGGTWTKTVIWECPYPLWAVGQVTDTFYCPDGSHHLAFDNNGLIHTVFSLSRGLSDGATQSYFPGVDGVVYWNESMPSFSSNKNALNPYGHPDSELEEDVSLIGWSQDVDGDGQITFLDPLATYNTGLSSQPQMVIDDQNRIFVIYSSITETFSNGVSNYRHLWARSSPDGGTSWGTFYDLTGTLLYTYDECVYPSVSPISDENIYLTYQADNVPGTVTNSTDEIFIRFMSVVKEDILNGVSENSAIISDSKVSQNYPNPFNGSSNVFVILDKPASLSLEVSNLLGQVVYSIPEKQYPTGKNELTINASGLESGIYFYTVRSGENSVTKKMMIE
jgi:hypothetical protein